jgi:hypothetical protein
MAKSTFRFTLTHSSGSQVIDEPIGWKTIKLVLERDPEYHSLIEFFESPLIFYGRNSRKDGGKVFIDNILENFGFDEVIEIRIEASQNGAAYTEVFSGILSLESAKTLDSRKIQIPITRNDFWTAFKNHEDTPVNIQSTTDLYDGAVDPAEAVTLSLVSQVINQRTQYTGHSGDIATIAECIVATTGNISLSGLQTIDGVALIVGRRVLVKDQGAAAENGVYIVSTGAWTRATDANEGTELANGIVFVRSGTVNTGKTFKQTVDPVTVDSTALTWAEYNYVDDYLLFDYEDDGTTDVCSEDIADIYFSATVDKGQSEINETYTIPVSAVAAPIDVPNQVELVEGFGDMTISGTIELSFDDEIASNSGGVIDQKDIHVEWYYQINDETPVLIDDDVQIVTGPPYAGPYSATVSGTATFAVNLGDRVKTYIRINIIPDWSECTGDYFTRKIYGGIVSSEVNFDFKSLSDDTEAEGFFIHDVLAAVVERITGRPDSFYSEYFGSPYTKARQYEEAGCGSHYTLHKGLHIRGYTLTEKIFSISFKDCWNGVNPIFNLGCGYETIDGVEVIRIEPKAHFYDPNPIVQFSYVNGQTEGYDKDLIFKRVFIGYEQWQAEEIRGLDDPQAKHYYATRMKTSGKELTIYSKFIAASLAIEVTRRKTAERSADYKFDNNTFIIAISDISETLLLPELDENFTSITNMSNSDSRYNLRLTAGRNFGRWYNFLNGCLQDYLSSVYKFTGGEGNYDLITDANTSPTDHCFGEESFLLTAFSEKQDIPAGVNYLMRPDTIEIEKHPLALADYFELQASRKEALQTSTSATDHFVVFIKRLEYDINKSTGKLIAWKR